ncbi:OmcA/MtrC family decaheme c-type cytochrome [Sinimarinibacterium sp. CAU 1509]|uniref:OmcA/MtrC family decaheme c-type cytochrome n=1 Tax=Sinimarinibacterium sp. CAU 1509 TaxID=2562283 RepID=UPI0010ABC6BC|nr:OmcA/MtrC family decaheme c-type cytochrome [Sinimarinibacterium sp. CAU 1509]TJY58930.1 OmcA/MtrC family decaheme c-type cytochrome [Sinimarinibacterium sp. CAU 1509]
MSSIWRVIARAVFSVVVALGLLGSLAACDGGNDGAPGTAGPPGPGVTTEATALKVTITGVSIASKPVVEFSVVNERDVPVVRLDGARMTLAKLIPGTDGNSDAWQSYINRIEVAGSVGPGTQDQIQATTDSGGSLVDHGNGTYTYTFGSDVTAIAAPLAVAYEPALTHRIGLQVSSTTLPAANATYTWRPSDGATSDILNNDIVQTASCNECHGKLALHGGGRLDTQYCVTCHNPGSHDANSGNTIDFKVMVHKIHRGENLPSVEAGGEYAIWGFRDSKHDYSTVAYPQDIRNCSKCHDAADSGTPQASRWSTQPTREACGACHDNVNFETGEGHGEDSVVAANGECSVCHSEGGLAGSVTESHRNPLREASQRYQLNILSVSKTAPGQFPIVKLSVTDPTHSDAPYDLLNDPEWTSSSASLSLLFGWDTSDYHNTGNGSSTTPASAISLNAKTLATASGSGTFTVTSTSAIPKTATGSAAIGLYGRAAADVDGDGVYSDRVPIKSVVSFAPITDTKAVARRQVVDIAKCDQCHDQLTIHGGSRTDEPQLCVMCHNANNTDIGRRPSSASLALDGKREETVDMKVMIHAIHGAGFREKGVVIYGFGNNANDFGEVEFPGIVSNCTTCHSGSSYMPPLASTVLATTADSGGSVADPNDDTNITATAAACSSCHDGETAQAHMEQNGASFGTPQSMVDNGSITETCEVCHAAGRIADVAAVHHVTQ